MNLRRVSILLAVALLGCEPDQGQFVKLTIAPSTVSMFPSANVSFLVSGVTRGGDTIAIAEPLLTADLGGDLIGGNYRSPVAPGRYVVIARIPQASDTAIIDVVARPPAEIVVSSSATSVAPSGSVSFTAVVLNNAGDTIEFPRVWSATGGSITQQGRWTAPASLGQFAISATAGTVTGSASVDVLASGPPPILTSISRGAASAAGGARITIFGRSFADPMTVRLGTFVATVVSSTDTSVTVTVPASTVGITNVTASSPFGSDTLLAAFEYLPASTATYLASGFETGTLAGAGFETDIGAGGSIQITSTAAATGTRSVRFLRDTSTGPAFIQQSGTPAVRNPATSQSNGLYFRFRIMIPTATVQNLRVPFSQIKIHLMRLTIGSGQPGYLMMGIGSAFGGDNLKIFVDNGILNIPGGSTDVTFGDGKWVEIQVWCRRTGGIGYSRIWVDGRLVATGQSDRMGSDDPNVVMKPRFGMSHSEKQSGAIELFVDDVVISNGFIDP